MADFYAARSGTIPPLPWSNFAPPLSSGYIKRAGAVTRCQHCGTYDLWADDPEAERMVYAMATNDWKDGVFRAESREAMMAVVKAELSNLSIHCPGCSGAMR